MCISFQHSAELKPRQCDDVGRPIAAVTGKVPVTGGRSVWKEGPLGEGPFIRCLVRWTPEIKHNSCKHTPRYKIYMHLLFVNSTEQKDRKNNVRQWINKKLNTRKRTCIVCYVTDVPSQKLILLNVVNFFGTNWFHFSMVHNNFSDSWNKWRNWFSFITFVRWPMQQWYVRFAVPRRNNHI